MVALLWFVLGVIVAGAIILGLLTMGTIGIDHD